MTTVCPKCGYARKASDSAPAWQCPKCGIAYNKATLQAVGGMATAPAMQRTASARRPAIQDDDDVVPIRNAPGLTTINGFGFKLYGQSDFEDDGSFMATHYFVVLFIPFLPLARYRVIREDDTYTFLGKGRLRTIDKVHLGIAAALVLWFYLANRSR